MLHWPGSLRAMLSSAPSQRTMDLQHELETTGENELETGENELETGEKMYFIKRSKLETGENELETGEKMYFIKRSNKVIFSS